jgi:hypothetical protein
VRDPRQATTATDIPTASRRSAWRSRLLQRAPGPESPERRDRGAVQRGMVLVLVGGGALWLALLAVIIALLR